MTAEAAIGSRLPRANARRHVNGRGAFVDDIVLPRMLHMAFLRSPHAHARIVRIDATAARALPGVAAIMTGTELARLHKPWSGTHRNQPALRSPPQHAMALERARWQGEPVVAVAAQTRAEAEDAVHLIEVEWAPLPAVTDPESKQLVHPELGNNIAFTKEISVGDTAGALAAAPIVVEESFRFGRHTGVPLEPRGLVAEFDPSVRRLTIHHNGQCPHMMQWLFAEILGLPERQVRVVCRDVGGSFGLKIHVYGDEMATAAMAIHLRRPVKFIADRLESFVTDVHARDHLTRARMGLDREGKIRALEVDDVIPIGAYSPYPRGSTTEAIHVTGMTGTQYRIEHYSARSRVVFQHKNVVSQYRAVGYPIAAAITERMMDKAAAACGLDPVELRRRNLVPQDAYPHTTVTGLKFEKLSQHACLNRLIDLVDYDKLRREQSELRKKRIYRGIGIALFVEGTGAGSLTFGPAGIRIGSQDGVMVRLDPSGDLHCAAGITEQGQGTDTMLAQVVADAVGVDPRTVCVTTGDTDTTPFGGGTWGSRGVATGGAAAWLAGRALRDNILEAAAAILHTDPGSLDIREGEVLGGSKALSLKELASIVYFRGHELPAELHPELVATRHFRLVGSSHFFVNGAHASHVEVNPDTGIVRLLKHWVVDDCGRMINPLLVEEQLRGGVTQGIGAALFENCLYDENGQLCNGNLADYLVPMAGEMPDIVCGHLETPTRMSELGAKGVGESGVVGAPAAVLNAVNDALSPLGASIAETPITPRVVLHALGKLKR